MDKLQHIYDKHAADFGLTGKKNPEQLKKLWEEIHRHLQNESTSEVRGSIVDSKQACSTTRTRTMLLSQTRSVSSSQLTKSAEFRPHTPNLRGG